MNKSILCLTLILISVVGLAQEKVYWKSVLQDSTKDCKWANQINRLVSPRYVLLAGESHSFYEEVIIGGQKLVIAAVSDTIHYEAYDDANNKIFVFSIKDRKLNITDSSAEYQQDGFGPQVEIHADSLVIIHAHHLGSETLIYKWDSQVNKYLLSLIESSSLESYRKHPGLNDYWHYSQVYDIKKQVLIVKSGNRQDKHAEDIWSKERSIPKKCPSTFLLKLRNMKDPSDYEVYGKLLDPGDKIYHYLGYASPPSGE